MSFAESLERGKQAEQFAEQYFEQNNLNYKDVRDEPMYQHIDVDYIVEGLGAVETKLNYHNARYGKPGLYFWVELKIGIKDGFWYKSKADYFLFFNGEGNGVLIENNNAFRKVIDNYIEHGDHSKDGISRIDIIKDERYNRFIEVTNMRVYMESLENAGVNITKIVKRKRI